MEKKTRALVKFCWSAAMVFLGLLLNYFRLGQGTFSPFESVGTFLIFVGFAGLAISAISEAWRKKQVTDERMEFVAAKALRLTFVLFIIGAFFVIVLDGIAPIAVPYSLSASYAICAALFVYFVSYKLLLRRY